MLLKFDFASGVPLYMQLRNQVVVAIAEGKIRPGERLPTIRALADQSGVNMMTISKAYQLLKQEGYILAERRSGAVVAPRKEKREPSPACVESLRLCLSELRLAGLSREAVLNLCRTIYEEDER